MEGARVNRANGPAGKGARRREWKWGSGGGTSERRKETSGRTEDAEGESRRINQHAEKGRESETEGNREKWRAIERNREE